MEGKGKKAILRLLAPAAVAAAACLACFFIVWFAYLRGSESKAKSVELNGDFSAETAPLAEGETTQQTFTSKGALYAVGVVFRKLDDSVAGTLTVRLTDAESGETVLAAEGNIAQVQYESFTAFSLDAPVTDSAALHRWTLEITAHYTAAAGSLALGKSTAVPAGFGTLTENGETAAGALALLAAQQQLGTLPLKGYWALGFVCAALTAGLTLLCRLHRPGKAALTVLAVLAAGLCYQFVLPAYSAPDEIIHYHTAYALSNQWMGVQPDDAANNFIERECDAAAEFTDYHTSAYTYRYLLSHFWDKAPAAAPMTESNVELLGGYPVPYLLSAAGITLARLLHFGGVGTAFFARLWNLAFFALAAGAAVRLVPRGKGIFAVLALLPMSLHLGGSFSYDSCLLSFSMLATALSLRMAWQEEKVSVWEIAALAVCCAVVAPLKAIYLPLCLLVFLVPAGQYAAKRVRLGARAAVLAAAFAAFGADTLRSVLGVLSHQAAAAGAAAATSAAADAGNYSIFALLRSPGVFLKLLCNTFLPQADRYAASVIGGSLGYLNLAEIRLSALLVVGFLLLLLAAAVPQAGQERTLLPWQKLLGVLIFLMAAGLLLAACIQWTPLSYDFIWGFQGRYLLPVLPLLLLALPLERVHTQGDTFYGLVLGGFALEVLTLLNVLSVVYQR